MGSILSLPITVFANCGGSILGSCCTSIIFKTCCTNFIIAPKHSSLVYYFIMSLFVILSLVTEYNGGDIVLGANTIKHFLNSMYSNEKILTDQDCPEKYYAGWVVCCANTCSGIFSVYRFSFTMFCFSALMFLLTFKKSLFSSKVHCGFWIPKVLLIMSILVGTLFIENKSLIVYREISRYMSVPFLILQIALLIDFAYKCNEKCVELDEKISNKINFKTVIVSVSILLFIACLTTLTIMLTNFEYKENKCKIVIVITIFSILFTTGLSVSRVAPHGTIFTSAVVSFYTTYLCYSSISSVYENKSFENSNEPDLIIGLLFSSVSMASMTWTMTESQEALIGKTNLLEETEISQELCKKSWKYFHFMMVMCSLYMCMHLTNWSSDIDNNIILLNNDSSFWVKVYSQWLCFFLYTWTLCGPYILRNYRDFGVEFN